MRIIGASFHGPDDFSVTQPCQITETSKLSSNHIITLTLPSTIARAVLVSAGEGIQ